MPVRVADDDADIFLPVPGATSRGGGGGDCDGSSLSAFEFDDSNSTRLGRRVKRAKDYGHAAVELVMNPPFSREEVGDESTDGEEGEGGGVGRPTVRIRNPPLAETSPSVTSDSGDGDSSRSRPNGAYKNWSCDEDDDRGSANSNSDAVEDVLAWKIISAFLKGWFVVWILFAVLIISAELFSPHHSTKKASSAKAVIAVEDEQLFLEISEHVVEACSYSKLETEEGREGCQSLCRDRLCCFVDDEDGYGCVEDPDKKCAAYAGCEALIVSEDDAIIVDADGEDAVAEDDSVDAPVATTAEEPAQSTHSEQLQSSTGGAAANFTYSSKLQLVQQVVSTVCAPGNLHTHHGMLECASLCNPSMCCFDRAEIEALNPKMDLILKMEGITDDILDRSAMGTCINEEEVDDVRISSHFCKVHAGCENLLLLGAPPAAAKTRQHGDPLIFTSVGAYDANEQQAGSGAPSDQQRKVIAVGVLFCLAIGTTAYLLLYKRASPTESIGTVLRNSGRSSDESEMVEFV